MILILNTGFSFTFIFVCIIPNYIFCRKPVGQQRTLYLGLEELCSRNLIGTHRNVPISAAMLRSMARVEKFLKVCAKFLKRDNRCNSVFALRALIILPPPLLGWKNPIVFKITQPSKKTGLIGFYWVLGFFKITISVMYFKSEMFFKGKNR